LNGLTMECHNHGKSFLWMSWDSSSTMYVSTGMPRSLRWWMVLDRSCSISGYFPSHSVLDTRVPCHLL
jgi:hypothetical protein